MLHGHRTWLRSVILLKAIIVILKPVDVLFNMMRVCNLMSTDPAPAWKFDLLHVDRLKVETTIIIALRLLLLLLIRGGADSRVLVLELVVTHTTILLILHTVFEFDLVWLKHKRVIWWHVVGLVHVHARFLTLDVVRRFAIKVLLLAIHV